MSIRQMVTVTRGNMDKTPVCVFPWEIAILEELHGEVEIHEISDLVNMKGAVSIKPQKLRNKQIDIPPDLKEQYRVMCNTVPDQLDPFTNPEGEYYRMTSVYGMHPEVKMALVEKIFGSFREGRFTKLVNQTWKDNLKDTIRGEDDVEPEDTNLSGIEVRQALTDLGATFKASESVTNLNKRLGLINALQANHIIFNVNAPLDELKNLELELAEAA